jgi:hypothetical protein
LFGIWTVMLILTKNKPTKKCIGASLGKFLGFIVRYRGIEIERMLELKNILELKSLQGAYIQRFISNLAGWCQPFTHLMKDTSFY